MSLPIGNTPLVGRQRELAILTELVAASSNGPSGVALLSGEAGIGKSRLAAEVQAQATRHGFLTLQGRCFETDRDWPYAPLLDLLRGSSAGLAADEVLAILGAAAPALLAVLPELAPYFPDAVPAPPLDPEQEKRRLCQAFTRAVTDLAARRPVLLIIEDLHWGDEASLELLLYLARRLPPRAALLLLTYRSDEIPPALAHTLAELDRARLATEVILRPLTLPEMDALLRAIFGQEQPVRTDFLQTIHELTEGNPFFVEEVLKALVTDGDIFYTDGRWDRRPVRALRTPRTIEDAVRRRAERLSTATRDTLALAAVIGQRVDIALLAALTGHDEPELLRQIKELIAAQLVVEESAERIVFRHALTRWAVYGGLLARERRALHRQIAAALERLHAAHLDAHLNELAYHHHEAASWAKALDNARHAGERAQALFAPRAAVEHFTRALDATAALGLPPSPALHRARGQAYETLGEFTRAQADHEAALAAARNADDHRAEWQALLDLGFLWTSRDYAPADVYFREALALAREAGEAGHVAHSLNRLGNWHLNSGRPTDALRHYREALATFEGLDDRRGIAETLDLLGMAAVHGGDVIAGMDYFERAIPLLRELDDRRGLVSSLTMLAEISADLAGPADVTPPGSITEAFRRGEEAVVIARAIGWRAGEAYALMGLSSCPTALGDYGRALELIRAGQVIAEEIEHRGWLAGIRGGLGSLCLELLALPAARRHLERALAEAEEIGSGWITRLAAVSLARTCLKQGDLARAGTALDAAFGPDGPATSTQERSCWLVRAELALAGGEPQQALAIADRLIASAANRSATTVIPALWLPRGLALAALGQATEAKTTLRAAQETVRTQGRLPQLWHLHLALGRVYQAEARQDEAAREFVAARTVIEALAANLPDEPDPEIDERPLRELFLQEATALLPTPRPLTPLRAARQAFGGLTAREREVAALIAHGKPNRAIADELVISERTVTTHITSILTKLGFTSRAQIAAWIVERGLASADTR